MEGPINLSTRATHTGWVVSSISSTTTSRVKYLMTTTFFIFNKICNAIFYFIAKIIKKEAFGINLVRVEISTTRAMHYQG